MQLNQKEIKDEEPKTNPVADDNNNDLDVNGQAEGLDNQTEPNEDVDGVDTNNNPVQPDNVDEAGGDTLTPSDEVEGQGISNEVDENSNPNLENQEVQEKMLTQSQVNELVGRARQEGRDSAMKELYSRYGVADDNELNDIFGRGQTFDVLDEEYQAQGNSYKEALAENALLKSKINEDRFEDVKLILNGKGLDVTTDNIEALIPSHPEWRTLGVENGMNQNNVITPDAMEGIAKAINEKPLDKPQPSTLRKLGNEASPEPEESEEEKAKRIFGFK